MEVWFLGYGIIAGFLYTFLTVTGAVVVANLILNKGFGTGYIGSLGITAVQGIWATFAAFGLHLFSHMNLQTLHPYRGFAILGALLLFLMAYKVWRRRIEIRDHHLNKIKGWQAFFFLFGYALSLPLRVLVYAAIFVALAGQKVFMTPTWVNGLIPLGVLLGSGAWWLLFCLFMAKRKEKITHTQLENFRRISVTILLLLGGTALIQIYFT